MANTEDTREGLCARLRALGIDPATRESELERFMDSDRRCRELRKREIEGSEVGLTRAITAALTERRQAEKALFSDGPAEQRPRQTEIEKRAYACGIAYTAALTSPASQAWMLFFRDRKIYRADHPEYVKMRELHGEPSGFIDVFPNWREFILGGVCNPDGRGPLGDDGEPKFWEPTS
jgi:hypothetical protein